MYLYARMMWCVCQCVSACVPSSVEARGQSQLSTSTAVHIIIILFLKEDLLLNLELTDWLKWLANELPRYTCLSSSLQPWADRWTLTWVAFLWMLGIWTQVLMPAQCPLYRLYPSPWAQMFYILNKVYSSLTINDKEQGGKKP